MKEAKVYLREENKYVPVRITGDDKPELTHAIIEKWQSIITLTADIINVPAGLIMRITEGDMEVFCKSETENNPYLSNGKDQLGHGLYCETVIGRDSMLEVHNALEDEKWKDNPDVALNMISYLGVPIKWPDNEFFGTICVLDSQTNKFSEKYKQLLLEFKRAIELDLELMTNKEKLLYLSEMDMLTKTYNRHRTELLIENEFNRVERNKSTFSICMFDLDQFKYVNDTYGHDIGDEMLRVFAQAVKSRIRSTDMFGRWGGDEFILICPDTDEDGIVNLMDNNKESVIKEIRKIAAEVGVSFGIGTYKTNDSDYNQLIKRADEAMYHMKKIKKQQSSK